MLCRSSARAGEGKSPFQHPLSALERQSGQSCELPECCSQASGAALQTASADPCCSFHREPGKWLIPAWTLLSLAWPWRGAGPGGFLLELWAQECFPSRVGAWLAASSGSNELPAFSRPGRRVWNDPSGSTVWRARATADGFCPSPWIQGCPCGVLNDGNAQCRVGDSSLDPGVRGFPKPGLSCKCR